MNKIDYVNSELINNKLNDMCNSESINILNHCNVRKFDPEKEGSLKPQGKLEKREISWEENLIMNLNNMHKSSRDHLKTSYVKYKLFKLDIYGLALVDTGNLVKGTLVSREFWEMIGGKCQQGVMPGWVLQRKEERG